jgi:hypothetical protein
MDWQTIAAVAIVIITLAIFIRRWLKPKKKSGCSHGCCDK